MSNFLTTKLSAFAFCMCTMFTNTAFASDALDAVNAQVNQKAQQIDQNYGLLLTVEERQSLKMSIIVKKVTQGVGPLTRAELVELARSTDATYAIDDPVEQRKLLIELEESVEVISYSTGSGGALHPVYP